LLQLVAAVVFRRRLQIRLLRICTRVTLPIHRIAVDDILSVFYGAVNVPPLLLQSTSTTRTKIVRHRCFLYRYTKLPQMPKYD